MNKRKVTSSDVAKKAGVSQASVSMILNKKYNVSFSKEVVQRVESAAKELGYELPHRKPCLLYTSSYKDRKKQQFYKCGDRADRALDHR